MRPGVLAFDTSYGVVLAVGPPVAELLLRIARPHDAVLGCIPSLAGMHDVEDYPGRAGHCRLAAGR